MTIEFEQAPASCRQSLEKIYNIIDSIGCLEEFLAAAPALAQPQARINVLGVIWRIGTGVWSWAANRKSTSKLLEPILQNRVKQVIDFELLKHNNDSELSKQWTRIRREFIR